MMRRNSILSPDIRSSVEKVTYSSMTVKMNKHWKYRFFFGRNIGNIVSFKAVWQFGTKMGYFMLLLAE